jgi:uncharacterized protein (UPF0264 family)
MTRLLVSVRSANEARAALAGGADIIDVKEPLRGSLGRADEPVWREVAAAVGNSAPVSVALGELKDWEMEPEDSGFGTRDSGLAFAKVGLAGCPSEMRWQESLQKFWQSLPETIQPVAVVYADWQAVGAPPPDAVRQFAVQIGVRYLLVDTYGKTAGRLLDHWPLAGLGRFAAQVQEQHQKLVLAGSLDAASIAQVLPLHPWAVAVRGAVCRGNRQGDVAAELVRQLRELLRSEPTQASRHALPPAGGESLYR